MKPKRAFILALLLAIAGNLQALDLTPFKYCAPVSVEQGAAPYGRLFLTPEVYDAAREDLGDIRLVGSGGDQIPYILARAEDKTTEIKYQPAIINRSTSSRGAAAATLDFGQLTVKNSIEVRTRGSNFRRAVKVEGSNDNIEFFTVVDRAYVFAVGSNTRFERIDLPTNDFRYLRITVEPMLTEESAVALEEVRAFKLENRDAERLSVQMTLLRHDEDANNRSSIYIYDLKYRHLPVNEIHLQVADDSFYRYVTIEGRDAVTRKVKIDSEDNRPRYREVEVRWERMVSDAIHRYAAPDGRRHEKLILRVPSQRTFRYLKIAVSNYDDKPLLIDSASARMIPHQIVFPIKQESDATFYVGASSLAPPVYDLRHRLRRPLRVEARESSMANIADNPLFVQAPAKQLPWSERHKVVLLIILVAVVLVLGGFILHSLRSIKSQQAQNDTSEPG
ncbi:MAG TPA: DUF3999 family protein [Sedimentisphaerales bacterium]|nr:DUF3999 family protein [Sedimentisphaerales bacterium]